MSLNIRGSAPVVEQQPWNGGRSTSNDRRNATTLIPAPADSVTSASSAEYTRPEVQVHNPNPAPALTISEPSVFSSEPQQSRRPEPPAKLLRFKIPTLQIRPRQDEPTAKRKAPELFTPRGAYASESDNESLANSSDGSISTQATSVLSDEDSTMEPVTFNQIRPNPVTRRPSASAGPSRQRTEYTDESSNDPGRVLHIHIKSKQQQQQKVLPAVAPKPAITSRRTPMITQAPAISQNSDAGAQHQLVSSRHRGAASDAGSSAMLQELDTLRNEVDALRSKESKTARELSDFQQRLEELQKDKEELRSEKNKLQQANDQLEADLSKQAKQLDKTRDKFDDAKKTAERLEQERDSKLEKAKKDRTLAIQKIHKERDQTQERIEKDHGDALKKLEEERDQLAADKNSLDAKLKELEQHLGQYKELSNNLRTNYEALEKEAHHQTDFKAQVEAKTINLKRELNDNVAIQKAQENSYKAQITRLEISLEARELKIKNLEDELVKSTTNGVELTAARDQLKVELDEHKSRIETLGKEISSLGDDKAELQKQLDGVRQDRTSLQEIIETNKENHQKELSSKDSSIADLEGETQTLKGELESIKEEHKAATTKIEELEAEKEKSQEQIKSLNDQLEQLTKEKEEAASQIAQLKEECDTLRSENESLQPAAIEEQAAAKAAEHAAEIQGLQDRISELEAQHNDAQAKTAEVEQQLAKEKGALESAENEIGALHQRTVDLVAQIADYHKRGRPKKKRDPKKAEKILAVRCPRDSSTEISIVRRKNIHQVQSSSMSDGSKSE